MYSLCNSQLMGYWDHCNVPINVSYIISLFINGIDIMGIHTPPPKPIYRWAANMIACHRRCIALGFPHYIN